MQLLRRATTPAAAAASSSRSRPCCSVAAPMNQQIRPSHAISAVAARPAAAAAATAAAAVGRTAARRRGAVVVRAVGQGMAPELRTAIDQLIANNKIVVFMKGTKQFPQCGFSQTVVQILGALEVQEFEAVNILENEMLRSGMKEYSQWPTFPQVYIDGEFFGGCDIMIESFQSGELQELLERVRNG